MKRLHEISPVTAVHKGMAPFLIIHGTADNQVAFEESPAMCEAMHKVGAKCDLIRWKAAATACRAGRSQPAMQHWKTDLAAWLKTTLNVP